MQTATKPTGSVWRSVRDLDPSLYNYTFQGTREAARRWNDLGQKLEDPAIDKSGMDIWLKSQNRAFAI